MTAQPGEPAAVAERRRLLAETGLALGAGLFAAAGALLGFAVLARRISRAPAVALDLTVLAALREHASPMLDTAAVVLSFLGGTGLFLLALAIVLPLVRRTQWLIALQIVVAAGGAQLLDDGLKLIYQRARPEVIGIALRPRSYSFPSGHAMVAAAFYLFLAYLALRFLRGGWRWAATIAAVALVLLIGLARLYLAVHYLSDVVAGYSAGLIWCLATIAGGQLFDRYRRRDNPMMPNDAPAA